MIYRLRAQQIVIDIPRSDSVPWVLVVIQQIQYNDDGSIANQIDRWESIHKKLSDIADEIYDSKDPFTDEDGRLSLYVVSSVIKEAVTAWIAQKYGYTLDDNGHAVKWL